MLRHFGVFLVTTFAGVLPAQTSLRDAILQRIARDSGAVVGVAFRDLATGDTLYINADSLFHAASTMKVPVMLELYRQAEQGGLPLDQRVLLSTASHRSPTHRTTA